MRNNEVLKCESDVAFAMAAALANILIFIIVAATLWFIHTVYTDLLSREAVAPRLEVVCRWCTKPIQSTLIDHKLNSYHVRSGRNEEVRNGKRLVGSEGVYG